MRRSICTCEKEEIMIVEILKFSFGLENFVAQVVIVEDKKTAYQLMEEVPGTVVDFKLQNNEWNLPGSKEIFESCLCEA
jgi:hypothetical protein